GIMIGKKQSKDNYYIDETTHKATTLGSTNGEVTVQAGGTVHLTTTNAVGKNGVVILGQDIILDGKDDLYKQEERHERKSSGLTVSLGGSVVEKIDSAVKKQHSASDRRNSRFKSLEGKQSMDRLLSAIGEAKQIVDRSYNGQMRAINSQLERVNADIVNTPETDATKLAELKAKQEFLLKRRSTLEENKSVVDKATDKAIDRAINVQIGIGSSKSVAESKLERHTYSSGTIDSDGTVLIHANSADSIKGNITAIGEQIKGKNVQLAASNTINLEAGSNTQRVETNSKSSGWNVSANIGMRTGGLVGWSASAYKGTENGIEDTTTHTGTHVVGTNNVSIESGSNTNLIGSTVSGRGVTAKVGNNLTVESLQDSQIYHETSKNKGISISGANFISQPTINGVNVKGNIDSTYKSVTDQSGIHAGNDGVNITVTNLIGSTVSGRGVTAKVGN
ncbi:MAG: hemagglutinin repeat-containing protein, partial [Veillonella sp.]|nr:hemagglutinin repeat-containing protein [Veillonella sp.]